MTNVQKANNSDLEFTVSYMLKDIGVPANLKGYPYLREAIIAVLNDISLIRAVTKRLYPLVAEKYDTSTASVERTIRHAVVTAWERGDKDLLRDLFGHTIKSTRGNPSNAEFIATVADRIRLSNKSALNH